jgi:hypothetical protein
MTWRPAKPVQTPPKISISTVMNDNTLSLEINVKSYQLKKTIPITDISHAMPSISSQENTLPLTIL